MSGGSTRSRGRAAGTARAAAIARFVAILLTILAVLWGVVGVVLAPLLPGGWWTMLAIAIFATPLPLALLLVERSRGLYPGRWTRLLVLRPFWYTQLALLVVAPLTVLGLLGGALVGAAPAAGRWTLGVATGLLGLVFLAGYVSSQRLTVRRLTLRVAGLPSEFDGYRIVQLSDLHVGPHTSRRFLARVAQRTRQAEGDLIVVTGDLIDDHALDVACYAAALGDLSAPDGVVAIAGNHDVYAGWPDVRARLSQLPLTVLVNESRLLQRGAARLALVGTGDPAGGRGGSDSGGPDLERALAGVPAGVPVLALAHNPVLWPALAERGVALTLSGHTHYGQFAIPSLGWSLASPFLSHAMGVHQQGRSVLFIHPGTNYWGIPFRLGTPPEVVVIELAGGSGDES